MIERLRKLQCAEGEVYDANYEEIVSIVKHYNHEKYTSKEVYKEFEEGGRWSNYRGNVYKINCNGETAYFKLFTEVPASETQDGMYLIYDFYEVVPKEVTIVKYVLKEEVSNKFES